MTTPRPALGAAPTLLDIYLALSHIVPATGPLAPLPGEEPEERPRVYVAHTAADEWRVVLSPDLAVGLRLRREALPPARVLGEYAAVARLLAPASAGERNTAPLQEPGSDRWVGRTLLFPEDLTPALSRRPLGDIARVAPATPGDDAYGGPAPSSARLRPALAQADEAPPARAVFPDEQFIAIAAGQVVATCESARESALAAEAWVRTLPAARGQGYATRVTAAWALDVRHRGKIPFYSHHRANAASAGVARALGLLPFLEDVGYL